MHMKANDCSSSQELVHIYIQLCAHKQLQPHPSIHTSTHTHTLKCIHTQAYIQLGLGNIQCIDIVILKCHDNHY